MSSPWAVLTRVGLLLVVAVSILVVGRLDDGRWGEQLRARFVAGVPWGTLVTTGFVLAVYLFVQGGFAHWRTPVSIPFRAWSYLYPLGTVVAPFSHVSPSHLTGNLLGTLVLASVAEFAWGHYPAERDAVRASSRVFPSSSRATSLAATPIARVLAVPVGAIGVGLLTGLFSIGPVIGFSGVVFAFAGFALVRYPLATVVAYAASGVLGQIYYALRTPVVNASAGPGGFGPPWWATIAIQAHALGLLVGVVLAVWVFRRREAMPSAGRLWLGTLVFAVGQSLWAVYWFRGNGRFVLFRALGVVLVFALAFLVAASISMPGRFRPTRRWVGGVERRSGAAVVVALALVVVAAPAIPANLTTTAASEAAIAPAAASASGPVEELSVRDYTVYYAENVTNREVSAVDLSAFNQSTTVNASGVIVASDRRNLWTVGVQKSRLAFAGRTTVGLGGIGWRERVSVARNGWNVAGGGHVYKVRLGRGARANRLAYRSDPATARATIEGRNVSVVARARGFGLAVSRANETLDRVRLPKNGTSVRAANLTFTRDRKELFVSAGGTRIRIAKHENYR